MSPPQFETRPWQIITSPNPNMQIDTKRHISSSLSKIARAVTGSKLTPHMWLELLEQHIRRNLEQNVRHEEDGERGIVLRAVHNVQVLLEPQDGSITDVDSVRAVLSGRMRPNSINWREVLTGPKRQAGTAHISTAEYASQSWPSACARWSS